MILYIDIYLFKGFHHLKYLDNFHLYNASVDMSFDALWVFNLELGASAKHLIELPI